MAVMENARRIDQTGQRRSEANKKKVRRIPVRDLLLPTIGDLPFDVRKLPLNPDEFNDIEQTDVPHRHQFCEIIHVTAGEGIHYIDFESHPLRKDSLYFISPGQVHFHDFHFAVEGHLIVFKSDFLILPSANHIQHYELSFFRRVQESPLLVLTKEQSAGIGALIQTIYNEYCAEERDRVSMLRAYLHIMIVQAQRLYDAAHAKEGSAGESSMVRRFMQLVSENFSRERSVRSYADSLGMNANHLSEVIKVLTGNPPGAIIRRQIVLEAKRLLAVTDLTAAEIGYTMNFEDPSYFCRFLKRETGLSPSRLRRHIREKYLLSRE
ncbi:MAG: helix-turn-helix domain-containing protein [Deltaproteobacteria bacterium]|nr:helix-turn-helix domain-containing protein [Deltaproteobacteria bacterium]